MSLNEWRDRALGAIAWLKKVEANTLGRLFLNPLKARITIAVFLAVLLWAFSSMCRAAEPSQLWLEVGSTVVRAEAPVVGFSIEWPKAGPKDTDWLLGLHLIGESEEVGGRNQAALSLLLVDGISRLDVGLGICLLHHKDARNGTVANFGLYLAYRFRPRARAPARHCSSAGMSAQNKGLDMALSAWRL